MNAALAPVLQQLRAGLEAQYGDRLDRVLLYGSQARGDAGPESDVESVGGVAGGVGSGEGVLSNETLGGAPSPGHSVSPSLRVARLGED